MSCVVITHMIDPILTEDSRMSRPERHRIPVTRQPDMTPFHLLGLVPLPSAPVTTQRERKAKKAKRKQAAQSRARNQR
jgi:hypothetical protein